MLDKYKKMQPVFYNYVLSSFNNNKISHAYLIETGNVGYGFDLALDLAKFFLCDGEFDSDICSFVDSNTYGDFKIIDCDKEISKDMIVDLKNDFSLSGSDKRRVYLIKDAAKFNKSSANSLLKFLEEPADGIIAILLADNIGKVIDTISSRCQIISLMNNDDFDYKTIFSYYDINIHGEYDSFLKNEINLFYDFFVSLEDGSCDFLVKYDCYSLTGKMKHLLLFGLYLYTDAIYRKLGIGKRYLPDLELENIVKKNEISGIIKKIDIINDFLYKLSFNVNLNLFMDNFVISMKGVNL